MDLPTISISPRLIPMAATQRRPIGTRSILTPAAPTVPAVRPSEQVPSVFDATPRGHAATDLFGTTVPGAPEAPRADRPRRIVAKGRPFGFDLPTFSVPGGGLAATLSQAASAAEAEARARGEAIARIQAEQAKLRSSLVAPPPPIEEPGPLPPPPPIDTPPPLAVVEPTFMERYGAMVAGGVAALAIVGVIVWKMGAGGTKVTPNRRRSYRGRRH